MKSVSSNTPFLSALDAMIRVAFFFMPHPGQMLLKIVLSDFSIPHRTSCGCFQRNQQTLCFSAYFISAVMVSGHEILPIGCLSKYLRRF